jgi:hypothetical protein
MEKINLSDLAVTRLIVSPGSLLMMMDGLVRDLQCRNKLKHEILFLDPNDTQE